MRSRLVLLSIFTCLIIAPKAKGQQKFIPSNVGAYELFGQSVAVSGPYAIAGAQFQNLLTGAGAAYIYEKVGNSWQEVAHLTPSTANNNALFGYSVDIFGDHAIIGARQDNNVGTFAGRAYIFKRSGDAWVEDAILSASDATTADFFGTSVAIGEHYAIIGAPLEDTKASQAGAAYIFARTPDGWIEEAKLLASNGRSFDGFGGAVSISGTTALIGATGVNANAPDAGAAYIFARTPSGWSEAAILTLADGQEDDLFGVSVSLDDHIAVVGASKSNLVAPNSGATYIYERTNDRWSQAAVVVDPAQTPNANFGASVSLLAERLLVGASGAAVRNQFQSGAAFTFERIDNSWFIESTLVASSRRSGDSFPAAVSLSESDVILGAPADGTNGTRAGAIYLMPLPEKPTEPRYPISGTVRNTLDIPLARVTLALDGDTSLTTQTSSLGSYSFTNLKAGSYTLSASIRGYVCSPGTITIALGEIRTDENFSCQFTNSLAEAFRASDVQLDDGFGSALSAHGEYAIVGAPYRVANEDTTGAAYIFKRSGDTWDEQARLLIPDSHPHQKVGLSVDLWENYAVIGTDVGLAYVYRRDTTTWTLETELAVSTSNRDRERPVTVSMWEETVFLGAPFDDTVAPNAGATYVFAYEEQTWSREDVLRPRTLQANASFGATIDLSRNHVLIGAPSTHDDPLNTGRAYVFQRNRTTEAWDLEAELEPDSQTSVAEFGSAVSLSGDLALIGAQGSRSNGPRSGAAYIFRRTEAQWHQEAILEAPNASSGDLFGYAVAASDSYAVVGAPFEDSQGEDKGAVYIFRLEETTWSLREVIVNSYAPSESYFGKALATSGTTALIGAQRGPFFRPLSGGIYTLALAPRFVIAGHVVTATGTGIPDAQIYLRGDKDGFKQSASDGSFVFSGLETGLYYVRALKPFLTCTPSAIKVSLTADTPLADFTCFESATHFSEQFITELDGTSSEDFGTAVSMFGNYAIIGAPREDTAAPNAGAASVYSNTGGSWVKQANLYPSNGSEEDRFGSKIALWGDYALIAAVRDDTRGDGAGAVYVFKRVGNTWQEEALLAPPTINRGDAFGADVALWGDYALIGSPNHARSGTDAGAVFVYKRNGNQWEEQIILTASNARRFDGFGHSVALWDNYAIVGSPSEDTNGISAGAAYIFEYKDGQWREQTILRASNGQARHFFGASVALSGDYAFVGAPDETTHGLQAGAVYVFKRNADGRWTEEQILHATPGNSHDNFGNAIALWGNHAVIGARINDGPLVDGRSDGINDVGAAFTFMYDGTTWKQRYVLAGTNGNRWDAFGHDVALWHRHALVGAPGQDTQRPDAGAAYTFITNSDALAANLSITGRVADMSSTPLVGVPVLLSGLHTNEAITDDNGTFTFTDLPLGSYTATINSEAFNCITREQFLSLTNHLALPTFTCFHAPPESWQAASHLEPHATVTIPASVQLNIKGWTLQAGDAIGFFYTDQNELQGAGYALWVDQQTIAVQILGDNTETLEKDGFRADELLQVKLWDASAQREYDAEIDLHGVAPRFASNSNYSVLTIASFASFQIPLSAQWNLISSPVAPDTLSIEAVFRPVIESTTLVKDAGGLVFWPSYGINTLKTWRPQASYLVHMEHPDTLLFKGETLNPDSTTLTLHQGWNQIAYLRNTPMVASEALSDLGAALVLAKDQDGNVYWPSQGIQTLLMEMGKGYKVYLNQDAQFRYPSNDVASKGTVLPIPLPQARPYDPISAGAASSLVAIRGAALQDKDELSLWTHDERMIGRAVVHKGIALVVLPASISTSSPIPGERIPGERNSGARQVSPVLTIRHWSQTTKATQELHAQSVKNLLYPDMQHTHISLTDDSIWEVNVTRDRPRHLSLEANYPNPLSQTTTIAFCLPDDNRTHLRIYDTLGRKVATLIDKHLTAGCYREVFNAMSFSSGTYFFRLETPTQTLTRAMQIVK